MFGMVGIMMYPARDLRAGIEAWTAVLGRGPAGEDPDSATFYASDGYVLVALQRRPWLDSPLAFWLVADIEVAWRDLVAAGATAQGETADGSMADLGSAEIVNGDPATGILTVPGRRLAVLKAADGSPIGLVQELPIVW